MSNFERICIWSMLFAFLGWLLLYIAAIRWVG